MIFIFSALKCEALPIIDFYKLKPIKKNVYKTDHITLIITGVGKKNTLCSLNAFKEECCEGIFLNIGIAGHISYPIGSCFLAHKITDEETQKSYYPTPLFSLPCKTSSILTVDSPRETYSCNNIIDMEASAFFSFAEKYTSREWIHSLKIISDNKHQSIAHICSKNVKFLIERNLETIKTVITNLCYEYKQFSREYPLIDISPFLQKWHFSTTQTFQLKKAVQKWVAYNLCEKIWKTIEKAKTAKEVINLLSNLP